MRHPSLRTIARLLDLALLALVALVLAIGGLNLLAPLAGRQAIAIRGASMEPAIPFGSLAIVNRDGLDAVAPGDAVTVRVGDRDSLVTHRVTRVIDHGGLRYYELRGDANATPDPALVRADELVGRVESTLPLLGYLLGILLLPIGFSAILCLAAALATAAWICEDLAGPPARADRRVPAPVPNRAESG